MWKKWKKKKKTSIWSHGWSHSQDTITSSSCPKIHFWPQDFVLPDESKDLQVPSGLSMPSFMNCTEVFGLSSKLTPPTRAASQCPWRIAWKAFSKANKLEEQAVSMAVLGPVKGKEMKVDLQKNTSKVRQIFQARVWNTDASLNWHVCSAWAVAYFS